MTPLGHEAQDFTADALLARLRVGHDALRGGDDGDAQPVEDLRQRVLAAVLAQARARNALQALDHRAAFVILQFDLELGLGAVLGHARTADAAFVLQHLGDGHLGPGGRRSEEHTSELQSLMRISSAVFCLKKTNNNIPKSDTNPVIKHLTTYITP